MSEKLYKGLLKYVTLFTSQRFTMAAITILVMTFGFKESDVSEVVKAISMVAISGVTILSYAVRKPGESSNPPASEDVLQLAKRINKYYEDK